MPAIREGARALRKRERSVLKLRSTFPFLCKDLHKKGKIEKFHQKADQFIEEIRVAHVHSLEELNRKWKIFLDQEYQKEARSGSREYYESYGVRVPSARISPEQEWRGLRLKSLVFLS